MKSNVHLAFTDWLFSICLPNSDAEALLMDERAVYVFCQELLSTDWGKHQSVRFEIPAIEISLIEFSALAERMAELVITGANHPITKWFADSKCKEYHNHLEFISNLNCAFTRLEQGALKDIAAELEMKQILFEDDLEVAFLRIEATEMKTKLRSIEDQDKIERFNSQANANASDLNLSKAFSSSNTNAAETDNSQIPNNKLNLFLRVAAIVIAMLGGLWLFWPVHPREFAENKNETNQKETFSKDTIEISNSTVSSPNLNKKDSASSSSSSNVNSPDKANQSTIANPNFITSYHIVGQGNYGFGQTKKPSLKVQIFPTQSSQVTYIFRGDSLCIFAREYSLFENGTVIDLDRCLKDTEPKSDCILYILLNSDYYSVQQVETETPLQQVRDEQLISILKSHAI